MSISKCFVHLSSRPVLGQSLANISVLRLDLCGGSAPGNKWFKLQENIALARKQGINTLVSFGGAWSNHLHALAAVGSELGLHTIGIIRGERPDKPSAMLRDAGAWGMELVYISRDEYRRRNEPQYIAKIYNRFHPCLLIPEGGANAAGVDGCKAIAELLLLGAGNGCHKVVLPVGTGTTLAGVARGLGSSFGGEVLGISVLKGAVDLDSRVAFFTKKNCAHWRILHDYHCGGYARVNPALREFILAFQDVHQIPLDPVYTGKALFAVHQLLVSRQWDREHPIVFVHTGGLQGRRGFSWLSEPI